MTGEIKTLRLSPDYRIKNFDCGDTDLNDYFHQELI